MKGFQIDNHNNSTISLALDTIQKKKQAIIFANTKRGAEKTAEDIAKKIKNIELINLSEEILKVLSKPTKQCIRLGNCIKKGIAFHHSGLTSKQRELIEDNFRTGNIKVIAATPTLAAGLDLPAFRVIMKDLRRFGHRGMQFIPVLEYMQMTGRAGRPKYDKEGEAISVASTESEAEEIEERYINGEPEEIFSKLAVEPVLRTYLLSLISSKYLNAKDKIFDFFSKTFWAFQFEDMEKLKFIIEKMLHQLEEWKFIESSDTNDGFLSAEEYGTIKYKSTTMGKRVTELYLDPLTANYIMECTERTKAKKVEDFSFLQMISHTLEMRPLLSTRNADMEYVEEALLEFDHCLIDLEPTMYDFEYQEYMNSIKTALFMKEWTNEIDEENLLEKFNIRPGEIKAKLNIADWLLYASEEICRIKKQHSLISEFRKLRVRLKYGVKEELLPLLKFKNIGRVRARSLFRNKIKEVSDVKKVDISTLNQILGKKLAADVKRQVGEKVAVVKENKRKGQINLKDY